MIRLCFPYKGVDIKIRSDGSYRVEGIVEYLSEIVDYALFLAKSSRTNFTNFYFADSHAECVQRIGNNLSDYGSGIYTQYEPSLYKVPVIEWGITLSIFTGYNVNEYQERVANSSKYTLVNNLRLYNPGIYLLTFLFFSLVAIVFCLQTRVNLCKNRKYPRMIERKKIGKNFRRLLSKSISRSICRDFRHVRVISFVLFVALFLIFLPFSILFKTSQVVNVEPKLVKSYRDIMSKNVSIYRMDISVNESLILQPRFGQVGEVAKFWHYWNKKKVDLPSMKNMSGFRHGMMDMTEGIVKQRNVYFGMYAVVLRSVLCMFSREPNLNNVQVFNDESTREIAAGFGAALEYKNEKFFAAKRTQVERGLNFYKSLRIPFYDLHFSEPEHFFKQRRVCMFGSSQSCNSQTFASGIQFFYSAFIILDYILLLANFCLIVEVMLGKSKFKRSTTTNGMSH